MLGDIFVKKLYANYDVIRSIGNSGCQIYSVTKNGGSISII